MRKIKPPMPSKMLPMLIGLWLCMVPVVMSTQFFPPGTGTHRSVAAPLES